MLLLAADMYLFVCGSSGYIGTKGNYIKVVAKKKLYIYIAKILAMLEENRDSEFIAFCLPASLCHTTKTNKKL